MQPCDTLSYPETNLRRFGSAGIAGDAESAPAGPEMPGQRSGKAEHCRQGIPVTLPADQLRHRSDDRRRHRHPEDQPGNPVIHQGVQLFIMAVSPGPAVRNAEGKMAEELEEMGYNMFHINDGFYKDYCTLYTSSDNTDMILSDRVDHIYNNNDAQCQENCEFSNYIFGSKYVNCTCNVDHKIESASQVKKIDKMDYKKFMQSFWYVLKYSNYKILKCYKLVFVKSVFTKNKGAIIIFILFILYLMCLIAYICQGIKPLQNSMQNLIEDNARINTRKSTATILFPPKKRKSSVKPRKPKDSAKILNKYDIDKKIKF